ncbi:MAG: hypothetical protein U0105_15610 [Candidatus Obscuribacterales bacterium]
MKSSPTTLHRPVADAASPAAVDALASNQASASSSWNDKILVAVFLAAILVLGALTWIISPDTKSDDENRELAALPKFDRKKKDEYPAQFEAFFNDHLAFRSNMVKARNLAKYSLFGVSTGPEAAVGKDGFLFFMGDDMERVCKVERPLTQRRLDDWTTAIVERRQLFDKHGIKYMFVVVPEKPSVYPDKVPPVLSPVRKVSGIDQLQQALQAVPGGAGASFFNLLKEETDGRQTRDTYLKTDSHWNAFGALLGYQAVMKQLRAWFPQLEPTLTEQQVDMRMLPFANGDCPKLMGLSHWITETAPRGDAVSRDPAISKLMNIELDRTDWERHDAAAQNLPTAVILHDSFGFTLKPYIYNHFKKVHFVRQSTYAFDEKLIDKYKPDVVIQLLVERHVMMVVPDHSRDWRHWLKSAIEKQAAQAPAAIPGAAAAPKWLNILPSTEVFNVSALNEIKFGDVKPTTMRHYTKRGDTIEFTPESAQFADYYLLKSGDQGYKLADSASRHAYEQLQTFITSSGKYVKADEFVLPDNEVLTLYVRKKN